MAEDYFVGQLRNFVPHLCPQHPMALNHDRDEDEIMFGHHPKDVFPFGHPPPPLSTSLVVALCQFHEPYVNVFPYSRTFCDTTLARGDNTQPRYMHGPCSHVHLFQPYMSLG